MLTCFHFVKAIKSSNPSPQYWVTTTLSICTRTATQVSLFGHWWQTHRVFNPFLCLLRFWDTSHTPMLPLVRHLQGDHWSHRLQKDFENEKLSTEMFSCRSNHQTEKQTKFNLPFLLSSSFSSQGKCPSPVPFALDCCCCYCCCLLCTDCMTHSQTAETCE